MKAKVKTSTRPKDSKISVPYSYLDRQFSESEAIWKDLRELVRTGEFTIGPPVIEFERRLSAMVGVKHALGTNTGTDALILALKGLGVGPGDEVITQPNTFFATAGAIVAVGAKPVFVDVDDSYSINVRLIEEAITPRTRALLPVHWTGLPADMPAILDIARRRKLPVLEDACPALGGSLQGRSVGSFGSAAAFSMHPLKPLNVWGDGGAIVTDDDRLIGWLRLYRNHGMKNRDEIEFWGVNSRLQSVQAVVANHVIGTVNAAVARRNEIARTLDKALRDIPEIKVPPRPANRVHAFQLYIVRVQRRDELIRFLASQRVEAKIHYPIPLHLQKAAQSMGHKPGDFPECEAQAREIVTLPGHQFLTDEEVQYMIDCIRRFYTR